MNQLPDKKTMIDKLVILTQVGGVLGREGFEDLPSEDLEAIYKALVLGIIEDENIKEKTTEASKTHINESKQEDYLKTSKNVGWGTSGPLYIKLGIIPSKEKK